MTPKFKPAMNPTVEDEVAHGVPANPNSNPNPDGTPVPWSEVCFCCASREPGEL